MTIHYIQGITSEKFIGDKISYLFQQIKKTFLELKDNKLDKKQKQLKTELKGYRASFAK